MKLRPETDQELSRRVLEQKGQYSMPMREFMDLVDSIQNIQPRRKEGFWKKFPLLSRLKTR